MIYLLLYTNQLQLKITIPLILKAMTNHLSEFGMSTMSTNPVIPAESSHHQPFGEREYSVQDIVEQVGTSQSNISQHLAILRDKGILSSRKDANRVYYRVSDARTLRLISMMREVFCSFCS